LSALALAFSLTPIGIASASHSGWQSRFDDPHFCSEKLASPHIHELTRSQHRRCVIAIASTYLIDGLQNKDADAPLLTDDVIRRTAGRPPSAIGAQAIRDGIRNGQEDAVGAVTNIQWTVDGNEAWVVWDGIFTGQTEPGFFVSERFRIRDGLISEIIIGGVQFPPGMCGQVTCAEQEQAARDAITDVAEVYMFKGFLERDVEAVRAVMHPNATRTENGVNTGATGDAIAEAFANPVFTVITGIENLHWTVDVQRGEAFATFDLTTTRSATPTRIFERFLVEDGLLKEIEAQFTIPPDSRPVCEVVPEISCP
jgi:hypothetical protein